MNTLRYSKLVNFKPDQLDLRPGQIMDQAPQDTCGKERLQLLKWVKILIAVLFTLCALDLAIFLITWNGL